MEVPVLQNQKCKRYYSQQKMSRCLCLRQPYIHVWELDLLQHYFLFYEHKQKCITAAELLEKTDIFCLLCRESSWWILQSGCLFSPPKKEKNGCSLCDTHLGGSVQPRLCISGASRKHNIYKIANLFQLKKMLHMHTHIISNHQYRQIFFFSIQLAHNCRLWSSRHHGKSLHCLR